MFLNHRYQTITPLPQMPGGAHSSVYETSVFAVQAAECAPQPICIGRDNHDVHMIGHQAKKQDLSLRPFGSIGKQTK